MSEYSTNSIKEDLDIFESELNEILIEKSKKDLIVKYQNKINNTDKDKSFTANRSKDTIIYGVAGATIGLGIGKFSSSYTTAHITLAAIGAIIGIGVSLFKSGKSKLPQYEYVGSTNINYFQSKQNLIVLIREVNKIVEQRWDEKLESIKCHLQDMIKESNIENDKKDQLLHYTYVYSPIILEQTNYLLRMSNLAEDVNFPKELEKIRQDWIAQSVNNINYTIENQWEAKYSKINL